MSVEENMARLRELAQGIEAAGGGALNPEPGRGPGWSAATLEYFAGHAIDPRLAAELVVRERPGRLIYPYADEQGAFERTRDLLSGKTFQPKGRDLCMWWPRGRPDEAPTVLVCEGEPDALAALTAIDAASSTTAPGSLLRALTVTAVPGTGFPADRLVGELQAVRAARAILAHDGDAAGEKAAAKAAEALTAAGIHPTRLLLPAGADLADVLCGADDQADCLASVIADAEAAEDEVRESAGGEAVAAAVGLNDLSYSEAIAREHGDTLRFVPGRGWLAWDGRRWVPGENVAREAAKGVARSRAQEAADAGDPGTAKIALARCEEPRIRGSLELAQTDPGVAVRADGLDADPLLLCARNGVVALTTGAIADHDPDLLMTQLAGAEYRADARSARWERFLQCATGGDLELSRYLQRAAGYSATGSTAEEVALFLHGPGASGKTTFVEALRAALGDYARTADFATFTAPTRGDGPTPAIARLVGARMVCASEVSAGQRFNPGRLKSLTGGERIVARHLHRDPFEFVPAFTLWFAANDKPAISAADDAAWRRLRLVPFTNAVAADERDPALKRALVNDVDERAAILAWVVQGAIAWHDQGLGTCAAVEQATAGYRDDNDPIAHWLANCCQLHPDNETYGGVLYRAYQAYCRESGEEACSNNDFARELEAHGLRRKRTKRGARWTGIGIRPREVAVTAQPGRPGGSTSAERKPQRAVTGVTPAGLACAGDDLVAAGDGAAVTSHSASQSHFEGRVTAVTAHSEISRVGARASGEFSHEPVTGVTPVTPARATRT